MQTWWRPREGVRAEEEVARLVDDHHTITEFAEEEGALQNLSVFAFVIPNKLDCAMVGDDGERLLFDEVGRLF
jgi:hypothetical protein